MAFQTTQAAPDGPPIVAGSRRASALMWMGAFLGGAVIAAVFLAFIWLDASREVRTLRADLAVTTSELTKSRVDSSALTERITRLDSENATLLADNNSMRTRLRLPARSRPAGAGPAPVTTAPAVVPARP